MSRDRGALQLPDLFLGLLTMVTIVAVFAPMLSKFTGLVMSELDPFSQLLLALFLPFVFLAFFVSLGVSARARQ
jgi:hypothetical protein